VAAASKKAKKNNYNVPLFYLLLLFAADCAEASSKGSMAARFILGGVSFN
jgi:hypothetical protein